jgi:uncharacterized protein
MAVMRGLAAAAILALTPGAAFAQEPSFDCAKASTPVEKSICDDANAGLAMRDGALARLYAALKGAGGQDDVVKNQAAWLKSRDACGTDAGCLEKRYDKRIAELARAAGDEAGVTGSYGYQLSPDTDQGTLWAMREADGTLAGNIDTVSGPGLNTCEISFDEARALGDAWLWIGPKEEALADHGECHILFRRGPRSIRVDSFDCEYYCGANAWFDETYKRQH